MNQELNTKYILGMTISGAKYSFQAALAAHSFLANENCINSLRLVCMEKDFLIFRNILSILGNSIQLSRITPWNDSDYLRMGLPKKHFDSELRGPVSAYYDRLKLFDKLTSNEVLIYLDADTLTLRKPRIEEIYKQILNNEKHFAAVPSHRPVHEKVSLTGTTNPYSYFNGGVWIADYTASNLFKQCISKVDEKIRLEPGPYYWRDNDILCCIFASNYYPLSPLYNLHSGYRKREMYSYEKLNSHVRRFIYNNPIILHLSGFSSVSYGKDVYNKIYLHRLKKLFNIIRINNDKSSIIDSYSFSQIASFVNPSFSLKIKGLISSIKIKIYSFLPYSLFIYLKKLLSRRNSHK